MSLTVKQEKFCQAYIESGDASKAYREAYDSKNMSDTTVNNKAYQLKKRGDIRARISELENEHQKRHNITVDDLIAELEEARQAALSAETPQTSAAVGATMGKAKLLGLDKQVIDNISSDGSMSQKPTVIQLLPVSVLNE